MPFPWSPPLSGIGHPHPQHVAAESPILGRVILLDECLFCASYTRGLHCYPAFQHQSPLVSSTCSQTRSPKPHIICHSVTTGLSVTCKNNLFNDLPLVLLLLGRGASLTTIQESYACIYIYVFMLRPLHPPKICLGSHSKY